MKYNDLQGNVFETGKEWLDHLDELHLERTGCLATFRNNKPHSCPNAVRKSDFIKSQEAWKK
jgi:hypothetical protein